MTGRSRIFVFTALVVGALLAASVGSLAQVGITWQGNEAIMPMHVFWASSCTYNGKIYVFGGSYSDSHGTQTTTKMVQIYDIAANSWSTGADLPTGRYLSTAVEVGGKIYVMGGRDAVGARDANQAYDPVANSWTSKKACPSAIRGHSAVAYNGKIFVFGGNTDSFQNTVNIYDTAADSWSTGATAAQYMAYGAADVIGNKALWYGNSYTSPVEGPTDISGNLYIYDLDANTWDPTAYPMMQPAECYGQHAADSSKLYIMGGKIWNDTVEFETPTEVCQAFDVNSKTWTQLNFMPTPIQRGQMLTGIANGKVYLFTGDQGDYALTAANDFSFVDVYDIASDTFLVATKPVINYGMIIAGPAGAIGGKIYAAHGLGGDPVDVYGKVDIYDPATNVWTTSSTASPKPTYYSAGGVSAGKLIVSGGVDGNQAIVGDTAAYDAAAGSWSALTPDTAKRFSAAGCVLDGKLYVFGGDTNWNNPTTAKSLTVLDIAANTWTAKKDLPSAMEGMVAVPYGGKIYIVGGAKAPALDKASAWNTQTIVYDPATDNYDTTKAAMPVPVAYAAGDVYGDYLFVHGGLFFYLNQYLAYFKDVQVYDLKNNTWTTLDGLFGRAYHNAVVGAGKLFVFNGYDLIATISQDRLNVGVITGVGPTPLTAGASGTPTTGAAPLHVTFTGSASGGNPPYSFSWNFGDGSSPSSDQSPTHDYATDGSYTATLTVTDSAAATATGSVFITVGGGTPLSVTVTADKTTGAPPLAVNFTATPAGGKPPYTFAWDFKDGETSTEQSPSHTFAADGDYNVTLTVTDSEAATVSANKPIHVLSVTPPTVTAATKKGNPFRIIITGSNLQSGIQVFIGNSATPWSPVAYKGTTKIVLKGGSSLKTAIPKGTPTPCTFKNPDGGTCSFTISW
jgi:PKD repeat protein